MTQIDIHSQMPGNAGILSNLHRKPFYMAGLHFGSIEGFLQGLRISDTEKQKEVFLLDGINAKRVGHLYPIKDQTLYFKDVAFNRHSDYYRKLVRTAFNHCFNQNDIFKRAIWETMDMDLIHTIGKNDPFDTILTNDEFIGNLMFLREYKDILEVQFGN